MAVGAGFVVDVGEVKPTNPWALVADLADCKAPDGTDDAHKLVALQVATEILYELSGRRYGLGEQTVRPQHLAGGCSCSGGRGWDGSDGNSASAVGFGASLLGAYGGWVPEVPFSGRVHSIESVMLDGAVLDPASYRLVDHARLVRVWANVPTGQALGWPCCQYLERELTEVGTFSVTYTRGTPPTQGAKTACQMLACYLLKQMRPGVSDLPTRTVQKSAQGISVTVLDPQTFIEKRRTGIPLVDAWLGAINPDKLRRRPTVTSPDSIRTPRVT